MATIRLYYGRDNIDMVHRLREAQRGRRKVSTVEVRETVLDENVIEAIVDLLSECSVDTVQLDDCGAYLNKQAIRMARALGKVRNVRLSEPTFLTMYFLDSLLVAATELQNLRIQDHLDCRQIQALSSGLKANQSLKTLDLSRSRLDSFSILAEGLKENRFLENLKLRSLGLSDEHALQILSAVSLHPSLVSLDLSFNHCRVSDYVASFLAVQKNIRELHLGYQNVWQAPRFDIGGLAETLKANSALKILSLPRNKLSDEDAIQLAAALRSNSSLEFLDLRENKIGDLGSIALADTATLNFSGLKEINLMKNMLGQRGRLAFLNAVTQNTNLVRLHLPGRMCPVLQRTEFIAALNMGGRQFLSQTPPLALWPFILERVNLIEWENNGNDFFDDSRSTYQFDVLLYLLQGPALFDGIICEKS